MQNENKPGEMPTTTIADPKITAVVTVEQKHVTQAVAPRPNVAAAPQPSSAQRAAENLETPVASPTTIALQTPLARNGAQQSSFLANSSDPLKLYVEFIDVEKINKETLTKYIVREMKVTFSGMWDGKLLKGAIRSIENSYKQIKHSKLRESAARRAKEAKL